MFDRLSYELGAPGSWTLLRAYYRMARLSGRSVPRAALVAWKMRR